MIAAFMGAVAQVLPFWREQGFDPVIGLFRERLSFSGEPIATPLRAMVQARQIYVFATAALRGWGEDGLDQAVQAMRRMRVLLAGDDVAAEGFAFSADAEGRHVETDYRDSYTHAFLLLSAALLHQATGDRDMLPLIHALTRFVDKQLTDTTHGGVHDRLPLGSMSGKRQNPIMHLLEAYVALEDALPGYGYAQRIERILTLFHRAMFNRSRAILVEHFAPDWSPHADPARRLLFEPGHHYEWIWLLAEVERLSGQDQTEERALLFATAQASGHAANGLIYDEVDGDQGVVSPGHRLWPHTEAIKAAVARHRSGDADARGFADRMAGLLCRHFLGKPFAAGWIDHIHADLSPRVDYVPASSLYHLLLAAIEARDAFEVDLFLADRAGIRLGI